MVKTRQAGQTGRTRGWFAWGSFGLALTLASGCSGAQHAAVPQGDPLYGVLVPPGLPQPGGAAPRVDAGPPPTPQALGPGGVPAIPASRTAAPPATLAGQGSLGQPTPLGENFNGPPFLPGRSTLGGQPPPITAPPPNASPKMQEVPDAQPAGQPVMPTASWNTNPPAAGQPTSAEVLLQQLQDRGVVNQKQDLTPEGIHLTCYIPRAEGGLRILEAIAADYPSAARAILQQLDAPR